MFDFTDYKLLAQAQNEEIQAWLKAHPTKRDYQCKNTRCSFELNIDNDDETVHQIVCPMCTTKLFTSNVAEYVVLSSLTTR